MTDATEKTADEAKQQELESRIKSLELQVAQARNDANEPSWLERFLFGSSDETSYY